VQRALITSALVGLLLTGCAVKPTPFSSADQLQFGADRLERVTVDQEPITHAIDLYEAMARAIKYNLDARVEVMEQALRTRELELAHYDLLPHLVSNSGYAGRTDIDTSSSSSRDDGVFTSDLTLSWNVLDFGLSYVRAKQSSDKVLIQEETKRKVINQTIQDVRTAYWRAVSYERLVNRMRALQGRVSTALNDTRALASSGNTSPIAALSYERELIQIQRELETLESQLQVAKTQLAALMNVRPETPFSLVVPKRRPSALKLAGSYHDLYLTALQNRPEMREIAYQLRINDHELDAQLLSLLPGLQLYVGGNYDSNEFINNSLWLDWGAKASWNLMRVFSLPATEAKIDAQGTLLDARSLSVAMAIMTQVHVSRARFMHSSKEFKTAGALAAVQGKLLAQVQAETAAQRTSEQILIREEMNALVTDSKLDLVYADLQNAYANVYASLGIDPFPAGVTSAASVAELSAALRQMWIERGQYPKVALTNN
jgi:outer membrane protein TolC